MSKTPLRTTCSNGHPYVEGSYFLTAKGYRVCRVCHRRRSRQWRLANPPAQCGVKGCDTLSKYSGKRSGNIPMCGKHHERYRKTGTTDSPLDTPTRWVDPKAGYVYLSKDGKKTLEHRVVMEDKLGRPLRKGENVHHINGVKSDNRPDNLELWVTSQPSGQRVDDLVSWAKGILDLYT